MSGELVTIPTRLWHGNELYPLPPNYLEMVANATTEGERDIVRMARVNACQQWRVSREEAATQMRQVTPTWDRLNSVDKGALVDMYRAEAMVASLRFFDQWYLHPDNEVGFDPMFYDMDPLETPSFHWDIIRGWAISPSTLDVAPRGSAKSMLFRKAAILYMLTCPVYKILYCTSSEKNATETAQLVRGQLYTNPRIQDDWRPEMMDGLIRPKRGDAPTGLEWFQLANGSQLATYSVNSKMRGGRPRWFALDDPEYDPHASTSLAERRSYMYRLIFKIAMPMLNRAQTRLSWLATFVSKRHYAWLAMETEKVVENGKIVERAKVPEFDYWERRVIKACKEVDGKLVSVWPHMWPVDDDEKERLGLDPSTKTLTYIRKIIGSNNFNSEMMANPGHDDDNYFKLDEHKHSWWILQSSIDEEWATAPWKSKTLIKWRSGEEERSMEAKDFLASLKMFTTVDTSKTAKPDSDFKVCTLMGENKQHDLFVLDMWAGKVHPEKLMQSIFEMTGKWRCKLVCPEMIDDGITLARSLKNEVKRKADLGYNLQQLPVIDGFNPGWADKNSKIGALFTRFEHGKIKLPFFMRMRKPWVDLFDQIEGFNPDVPDGGLANDDHIDTVSMSEFVKGRRAYRGEDQPSDTKDVVTLMGQGKVVDDMGNPLAYSLDINNMKVGDLVEMMRLVRNANPKGNFI